MEANDGEQMVTQWSNGVGSLVVNCCLKQLSRWLILVNDGQLMVNSYGSSMVNVGSWMVNSFFGQRSSMLVHDAAYSDDK